MKRSIGFVAWFLTTLAVTHSFSLNANAQSFLRRLEERLGGVLDEGAVRPAAGEAPRAAGGYLGLTAEDTRNGGPVTVVTVQSNSPAANAGLRVGDIILSIEGQEVTSLDRMGALLSQFDAGAELAFAVRRGERKQTMQVTLGQRPASGGAPVATEPPANRRGDAARGEPARGDSVRGRGARDARSALGVVVGPVTAEARRRYGLSVRQGAVVTSVVEGKPADLAGLRDGMAIVSVNGRRIDSPGELNTVLRDLSTQEPLEVTYYDGAELGRATVAWNADGRNDASDLAATPAAEPRPALKALERVLGQVTRPGNSTLPPPAAAEVPLDASLREEVESLRKRVEQLEQRLRELEKRPPAAELPP